MDEELLLSSNEFSHLIKINLKQGVRDINGNLLSIDDLRIGAEVIIYYFKRYPNYIPTEIDIDYIIVK